MKGILTLLISIFLVTPLFAREETIVGEQFHSGGYGGPVWRVGSVNGKAALFSGGHTDTIMAVAAARKRLMKAGIPVYNGVESASRAISKFSSYCLAHP